MRCGSHLRMVESSIFRLPPSLSLNARYAITWDSPAAVTGVLLRGTETTAAGGGEPVNSGSGTFYPIVLSGAYRLVHSGDVKIYERVAAGVDRRVSDHGRPNGSGRPTALASERWSLSSPCGVFSRFERALALMRDPAFDPGSTVLLIEEEPRPAESARGRATADSDEWVRVSLSGGQGDHRSAASSQGT